MMMRLSMLAGSVRVSIAALALGIVANDSRAQCQYEVIHIIKAPMCGEFASATIPIALNNHGQACGYFNPCPGAESRPWVWYGPGDFRVLTPPGGTEGGAGDIADDGTVVGHFHLASGPLRGFIYDPATNQYTVLSPPQFNGWCQATAINAKGQVVGDRSLTSDPTFYQAFVWEKGVFTDLGVMTGPRSSALDIADNGVVTGWTGSTTAQNSRCFIHADGKTTILPPIPGGFVSVGHSVNERGSIAGTGRQFDKTFGNHFRALAYVDQVMINLGALPGLENSGGQDINEANEIIGTSNGPGFRPTLWRDGRIYDLTDWLLPHPNVIYVAFGNAINDSGMVILDGDDGMGDTVSMIARPVTKSPADLNHDCRVAVEDLLLVIGHWGPGDSWTDITKDGIVNVADLIVVIQEWSS